jgi:hypothetical protein
MTGRVFISHSSADKPVARQLASDLRNRGIDVWIDEQAIAIGSSIGGAIAEGIDSSDYFVLLLSGKSVQSRWVHEEAQIAFQKSMESKFVIIPIRLDGTPVPRLIKHLKYVDFRNSRNDGFEELIAFLKHDDRLASDQRKAPPAAPAAQQGVGPGVGLSCVACLKSLSAKRLREKILERYNYHDLGVVWFDIFESRIGDDIPGTPLPNAVIELLDKAKRRQKFNELLNSICEQHPDICP